jgi:O-antigen/teichoic acid export membrane protein
MAGNQPPNGIPCHGNGKMGTVKLLVGKCQITMRDLRHPFSGSTLRGVVERYWQDPLYRNSLILTISRFFNAAVVGFLFWTIAAHQYPVAAVGIGTALIASANLLMSLSLLGFDVAIIRFTPLRDPAEVCSTCLWTTSAAALVLGGIFLLVVGILEPSIAMVVDIWPIFLVIVVLNTLIYILGRAFIAHRRPLLLFIQYVLTATRLPLLYPLVFLGGLGIFYAAGLGSLLAAVFSVIVILRFLRLTFGIRKDILQDMFRFSSANYVANLLSDIPDLILPLIVFALLGPVAAALYYIAFAIATMITVIPDAIGTSYFVEGSYGSGDSRREAIRALLVSGLVLLPISIGVILFGDAVLGFFGTAYMAAYPLLLLLTLSSFFIVFHKICIPFLNIRMSLGTVVGINGLRLVLLLGFAFLLLPQFGIAGAGYAYILTHAIIAVPLIWLLGRPAAGTASRIGEGA